MGEIAWTERGESKYGVLAFYRELTPNPAHEGDGSSGIHVSIDKNYKGEYFADCEAYGPNQYGRQHNRIFSVADYGIAKRLAESWIERARAWIAYELAHQVDRCEVTDGAGRTWQGECCGVAGRLDENRQTVLVRLLGDDLAQFRGTVRDGKVIVSHKWVRALDDHGDRPSDRCHFIDSNGQRRDGWLIGTIDDTAYIKVLEHSELLDGTVNYVATIPALSVEMEMPVITQPAVTLAAQEQPAKPQQLVLSI